MTTIPLNSLPDGIWDSLVVGAGPAGGMIAYELARRGHSVLLVDKQRFPRYKVCGCHFNPSALAALRAAGLGDLLARHGAVPVTEFTVAAGGRHATIPLPGSLSLSRSVFDAALAAAAVDRGVVFLDGTRAETGEATHAYREIALNQGDATVTVKTRILIAADGLGGVVLRKTGNVHASIRANSHIGAGAICPHAPEAYRAGCVYMACGRHGYVGAQTLEDGTLTLGASLHAGFVRSCDGLGDAAARILGEAGMEPIKGMESLPWKGVPELTRFPSKRWADRAFAVGDAAGYVEPFTGEGIAWSLSGASALAPIVSQAIAHYADDSGPLWESVYKDIVGNRQWVIRSISSALRFPLAVNVAVRTLSHFPVLAAPFVTRISRPAHS